MIQLIDGDKGPTFPEGKYEEAEAAFNSGRPVHVIFADGQTPCLLLGIGGYRAVAADSDTLVVIFQKTLSLHPDDQVRYIGKSFYSGLAGKCGPIFFIIFAIGFVMLIFS